jgi:hypothetical protein
MVDIQYMLADLKAEIYRMTFEWLKTPVRPEIIGRIPKVDYKVEKFPHKVVIR